MSIKNVVPMKTAAADSTYDFPLAHRPMEEMGINFFGVPSLPMTARKLNLSGAYICALIENDCGANGCIAVVAGCSGILGGKERLRRLFFAAKVFELKERYDA